MKSKPPSPKTRKSVKYAQNPFYDSVFGTFELFVPSKRIGYKQDKITKRIFDIVPPKGSKEFEAAIEKTFSKEFDPRWPYKGRLLLVIAIQMPKSDFRTKDVDNIAKSLLDAFKGIAYTDDAQICALYVIKQIYKQYNFMIGIKCLGDLDPGWYLPPLYFKMPLGQKSK